VDPENPVTLTDPIRVVPVAGPSPDEDHQVRGCLLEPQPRLPAWFGYDEVGSALFEQITALPTYYLTRTERGLLHRHAPEMAELLDHERIAELGSGSAKKTRLLLESCLRRGARTYLPIDVDRSVLESSSALLRAELPQLRITPLRGRYEDALSWLRSCGHGPLAVAFLGSNLGNATPDERSALLGEISRTLRPGDGFLVSADLAKPGEALERCYNDPPGHRAFTQFRLNYLTRLNRRYGAEFELDDFVPEAVHNPENSTVEGFVRARTDREVPIPGLDLTLHLRRGETINVGYSAKFDGRRLVDEITARGFALRQQWVDAEARYGLYLFGRTG
jgi:L-histidine N-alpha-methyltransferase